ncbi:helix-turn-helix domain-containing protein [Georgenia yuyongxinii]|uniref:winged helix-turn-helix domain-containing protein n=1 Tax=Georgenia yuyongxinii TaxID=2589797 RepID=UPI0022AAE37D|nr:helix-turn-helix domain-containing protein [Georgenia yuyongxinii]
MVAEPADGTGLGYQDAADARLVDTTIGRLRAKLGEDSALPRYIQTVRGFGYRFGPVHAIA